MVNFLDMIIQTIYVFISFIILSIILLLGFITHNKKIIKFSGSLLLILTSLCYFFYYFNKDVKPTSPTVSFTIVCNTTLYKLYYRTSNNKLNGYNPFKLSFLDGLNGRFLYGHSFDGKNESRKITIAQSGSIYLYNPRWRYKYGGGLQINGSDVINGSTIYVNAKMDVISLSGGKVYLDKKI